MGRDKGGGDVRGGWGKSVRKRARMRIADAEPAGLWVLDEKWEAISETMVLHMLEDH